MIEEDIHDKNQEWFNRLMKKAYGLETKLPDDDPLVGELKARRLDREVKKQEMKEFKENVLDGLSKEILPEDVKIVPTDDQPKPEVEEAAKDLTEWLQNNPEHREKINQDLYEKMVGKYL